MRKLFLLLAMVTMSVTIQAQQTYTTKELSIVRKMIRKPSMRKPLPRMMAFDRECESGIYAMDKLDDKALKNLFDSMEVRHNENLYLLERLPKALKEDQLEAAKEKIDREELRYDCFLKEYKSMLADRAADLREKPNADLVYVEYAWSGMSYNPVLPIILKKTDEEFDQVISWNGKRKTNVTKDALRKAQEIVDKNHLYRLHSSYRFRNVPLPDIQQIRMLDGERWKLYLEYADGTIIHSGGDHSPSLELHELVKLLIELAPKMEER